MPQKDFVLISVRLRVGFQKMVSINGAVLSVIHTEAPVSLVRAHSGQHLGASQLRAQPVHQVLRRLPGSSLTEFPSSGVVWFVARVVSILCQCLLLHWQEGRACRFHLSAVVTNEAQKELKRKMFFFFQVFRFTVLLLMPFLCYSP